MTRSERVNSYVANYCNSRYSPSVTVGTVRACCSAAHTHTHSDMRILFLPVSTRTLITQYRHLTRIFQQPPSTPLRTLKQEVFYFSVSYVCLPCLNQAYCESFYSKCDAINLSFKPQNQPGKRCANICELNRYINCGSLRLDALRKSPSPGG